MNNYKRMAQKCCHSNLAFQESNIWKAAVKHDQIVFQWKPWPAWLLKALVAWVRCDYCCLVTFKNRRPALPINPLNAELNPIRHLLALVEARHIVHVSRIWVNDPDEITTLSQFLGKELKQWKVGNPYHCRGSNPASHHEGVCRIGGKVPSIHNLGTRLEWVVSEI